MFPKETFPTPLPRELTCWHKLGLWMQTTDTKYFTNCNLQEKIMAMKRPDNVFPFLKRPVSMSLCSLDSQIPHLGILSFPCSIIFFEINISALIYIEFIENRNYHLRSFFKNCFSKQTWEKCYYGLSKSFTSYNFASRSKLYGQTFVDTWPSHHTIHSGCCYNL